MPQSDLTTQKDLSSPGAAELLGEHTVWGLILRSPLGQNPQHLPGAGGSIRQQRAKSTDGETHGRTEDLELVKSNWSAGEGESRPAGSPTLRSVPCPTSQTHSKDS